MGLLKKAALIGLLLMLPKILNSQTAKDFVKYMEDTGIPAIKNFFKNMLKFFKGIKEGGFGFLLESVGQNLKDVFDPNKETSFIAKLAAGATLLLGLKAFGILRSITGFMAAVTGVKALFNNMTNKIDPTKVPKDATTPTTKSGKPFGERGKNLTRYERKILKNEGLAVNKTGQVVEAKDMRKKASADKLAAAMKKFPNYGKIAKIAGKLGPIGKILTGAFLVNELLSGKSPAELAPQIAGLFTGLAGAGLGASAGAALGTALFPGVGTVAGLAAGTILGGLSGDMLGTALAEYALGLPLTGVIGSLQRRLSGGGIGKVDDTVTPDARSSMSSYGDTTSPQPDMSTEKTTTFTGTVSGEQSLALSRAMKTGNQAEIQRILAEIKSGKGASAADGLTPDSYASGQMQGQIINQNIITDKRSNTSSYVNQNSTITPSYGMTTSVINSI